MKIGDFLITIFLITSSLCLNRTHHTEYKRHMSNSRFKIQKGSCMKPQFPDDEIFLYLLESLKGKTPDEAIKILPTLLSKSQGEMLSPKQTTELFNKINFKYRLRDAIILIRKYLWIDSVNLLRLLRKTRSLEHRKIFIELLYPILLDHSKINLKHIRGHLACYDKHIMDELKRKYPHPYNCFFGDLSGNNVFVLDLSGSMGFEFKMKRHKKNKFLSRLNLVKILFKKAISSLKENQKIQIVTFGTKAKYFYGDNKDLYTLTKKNKKLYIDKVKMLQPGHGKDRYTNISNALEFALDIRQDYQRIVFFSDGGPTRGIWKLDELKIAIEKLQDQRVKNGFKKVPINVNLLMLGGTETNKFRETAKKYTRMIALVTGGIVKNFDTKK